MKANDTGLPLGYSVVALPSLNRKQFTSEQGGFTIWNLPAGRLQLRAMRIGYSPRDTILALRENDTVRVELTLNRLAIELPPVRVSGACGDKRPDDRVGGVLAELFDQVQQNADRYRLLADSNPFILTMYHVRGVRNNAGKIFATEIDTVTRGPFPFAAYVPRHLIHTQVDSLVAGVTQTHHYIAPPELADFADTAFTNNHCFTYDGVRVVDGDSVIAVDFEPTPALKGEVDFRGTLFVRASGYQLVRSELELTRVPSELRNSGMQRMTITTRFAEIRPGIAVLERVESSTKFSQQRYPSAEIGQVMDMKWVKGPPP